MRIKKLDRDEARSYVLNILSLPAYKIFDNFIFKSRDTHTNPRNLPVRKIF